MNILPFRLNVPAEVTLERPEGTLVQGRYGDRVMFSLADGRVMYVPPFVASKIDAEGCCRRALPTVQDAGEEGQPAND